MFCLILSSLAKECLADVNVGADMNFNTKYEDTKSYILLRMKLCFIGLVLLSYPLTVLRTLDDFALI